MRAKLPVRVVKRLLNAQHISPNSEQGRHLIELAWQVHRQEQEAKPPEPPSAAKAADVEHQLLTPEEQALMERDIAALLNDQDFWKNLEAFEIND